MKTSTTAPVVLLFAALLASCMPNQSTSEKSDSKVKMNPVTINDEYKMDIPEFMSKASSLNDDASLQYQNIFKETYVIVIDESKQEYIDTYKELDVYDTTRSVIANYADTQIQSTTENMEVLSQSEIKTFQINGLNAKSIEIDANVEGVNFPISYFLTYIEGREKLYLVMAWTLQDKKDKHRETFEEMVKTFRVFKKKSEDATAASE